MTLLQKATLLNVVTRLPTIQLAKYSVSSSKNVETFNFRSNFTEDEQTKILNVVNDSDTNVLSKFHIPQNRIKSIESWKNKKGPFRSLSEILEVDGLGEKMLHKMCEDIMKCDKPIDQLAVNNNNGKNKRNKQIVLPPINGSIINNLSTAVGIHLSPIGISWAKISKENNKLISWNYDNFSCLPNKLLPNETFDKTIQIVRKIPPSDVYVFESSPSMGPQASTSVSLASSYNQQLELNAMLLALLNTSVNHNITLQSVTNRDNPSTTTIENRVFYLKSRISARLFKTLVGQEKVAAVTTINQLLQSNEDLENSSLPCTPITVEQQLKNAFSSQSPANKELLGQALMLVITFMDLCIYKNPCSLATVYSTNRKIKK
ncbi:transcription elongation factor, mitochondrial [Diabrotica virgifera virgifera]|uniref:Transcription elongation factor, mitochondrial n=1 Tax=Diabrotica virgifera virgifera TaxID=50390 RepID=A0A6P7GIF2_DIAVI|nr:transcription elongation factor, mitochondrial [Diabrotica virgifera virgifera]